VRGRAFAAGLGPLIEMTELDGENRALNPLHAVVEALHDVVVALLLAPVAHHLDLPRVGRVVRRDGPAFAGGAEVLARVEAERGGVADAADAASLVLGGVRLAGVFDDGQSVPLRDGHDRI